MIQSQSSMMDKANINGEKCPVGFITGPWLWHTALQKQSYNSRNTKVHLIGVQIEGLLGMADVFSWGISRINQIVTKKWLR